MNTMKMVTRLSLMTAILIALGAGFAFAGDAAVPNTRFSTPKPRVVHEIIEVTSLDATLTQSVGEVDLTTPVSSGDAVVRFDGMIYVDPGTRAILAASDAVGYGINSGHVQVNGVGSTRMAYSFSHTRVYQVPSGATTTFFAVVDHLSGGSPNVSIYGTLTVEYFPDKW